ncbi:dsDNA nuclease domain-containing protein [Solibacillus sp. FSL K6-4121]|uniref:dsDNA nuclease domain-containing protein n=1 Tax=Solibacillus sp. FSL K6-4121 TaxID=2921505 RepID=UPI0030F539BF
MEEVDVRSRQIEKLKEYVEKENITLDEDIETVIDKLMGGKLRDIGGLTALRGFVYQYYVAIFYMIKMVYPKSIDTWWDYVVIEYFDDVTLLNENDVRFIQVKTIREGTGNLFTPYAFYNRSKPKIEDVLNKKAYFNSWLDKLFLNYDYFVEKHLNEGGVAIDKFLNPQFEVATNTPFSSSNKLKYKTNSKYNLEEKFDEDDVFLEKLESVKIDGDEAVDISFNEVLQKDIKFYLNRLFVNHLGSSIELKETIIQMIMETLDNTEIEKYSIATYIFDKIFAKVFSTTYSDNPNVTLDDLTFSKDYIQILFEEGKAEGAEVLARAVNNHTTYAMFDRAIKSLAQDINETYNNEDIKSDLKETLNWFYNSCNEEFEKDPKYLAVFLHKLFEMENNLPVDNYTGSNSEHHLKKSIEYIVNCLAFYVDKKSVFNNAKLLFHSGELNANQKLLFSIYNAQNKKDTTSVKNSIATTIQYCEVSKDITEGFCCLIIDDLETVSRSDDKIAALLQISSIEESQPKILESVKDLIFFDTNNMNEFIRRLKEINNTQKIVLKDDDFVKSWREIVGIPKKGD